MPGDWELLEDYRARGDQAAFAELVRRHVDMVHQSARRMLAAAGANPAEAEDVTQAVFLLLAQKAGRIRQKHGAALAGWLYRATAFACANLRKMQHRRRKHERKAGMNRAQRDIVTEKEHQDLAALLDQGLLRLAEKQRQAVLLRYLENRTIEETAMALEVSTEAVEKRAERGLAQMRAYFGKAGFAVPAAAVAGTMAAESAKAAPAALVAGIAGKAAAGSAGALALAKATSAMMTWHAVKFGAAAACVAATVGIAAAGVAVANHGGNAPQAPAPVTATIPLTIPAPETQVAAITPPANPAIGKQRPMMVRMDAVVSRTASDQLIRAGKKVPTASIGYDAYMIDAEKVRLELAAATTSGDVIFPINRLIVPYTFDSRDPNDGGPTGFFGGLAASLGGRSNQPPPEEFAITSGVAINQFFRHADGQVELVSTGQISHATLTAGKNLVHLKIQDDMHQMGFPQNPPGTHVAQVQFDADVPADGAAVFIGSLGTSDDRELVHLSIWHAFMASDKQWNYLSRRNAADWLSRSLEDEKNTIAQAIAWNDGAPDAINAVGGRWTRELKGGTKATLVALSDDRWPDCWWNADGERVSVGSMGMETITKTGNGPLARPMHAMVRIEDAYAEPTFSEPAATKLLKILRTQADGAASLRVFAGSGPWEEGPVISVGSTADVNGKTVSLKEVKLASPKMDSMPGSMWITMELDQRPEREAEVAAILKEKSRDGKPLIRGLQGYNDLLVQSPGDLTAGLAPPSPLMWNMPGTPDEVDHFLVRTRPRELAEFAEFTLNPKIEPNKFAAQSPEAATQPEAPATQTEKH